MASFPSRRLFMQVALLLAMLGLVWLSHFSYRAWQFKTLFAPNKIVENFRTPHRMFDTNLIRKIAPAFELEEMWQALPKEFSFNGETIAISDWIETAGTTGLVVISDNKVAFEQYYQGNTAQSQAISWSVGKSFVSALIGFALADGSITSLQDRVGEYVPLLKNSAYSDVSIQDVLEMSSGIDFNEDICRPGLWYQPIGTGNLLR